MPGVVADLRAVCPHRPLTFSEGLRVAELQANRLLEAAKDRADEAKAEYEAMKASAVERKRAIADKIKVLDS